MKRQSNKGPVGVAWCGCAGSLSFDRSRGWSLDLAVDGVRVEARSPEMRSLVAGAASLLVDGVGLQMS